MITVPLRSIDDPDRAGVLTWQGPGYPPAFAAPCSLSLAEQEATLGIFLRSRETTGGRTPDRPDDDVVRACNPLASVPKFTGTCNALTPARVEVLWGEATGLEVIVAAGAP